MDHLVRTSNEKISTIINSFVAQGIPFYMKTTNQRVEIYSDVANYSNRESEFPPHELNFIKKVKTSIIENQLYKGIPNRFKTPASKDKIKYYQFNGKYKLADQLTDCIEIDLKTAYWEMAYRLGLLSEELYQQGKTISKTSRLAAIGSLAKVDYHFVFDGTEQFELPPTRSELTEFLWDTICYRVSKVMEQAIKVAGNPFIFVWVDAMFIQKSALAPLKKFFSTEGFDISIEKVRQIDFNQSYIKVLGKGKWVKIDGKRVWKDYREFPINVSKETLIRETRYRGNIITSQPSMRRFWLTDMDNDPLRQMVRSLYHSEANS